MNFTDLLVLFRLGPITSYSAAGSKCSWEISASTALNGYAMYPVPRSAGMVTKARYIEDPYLKTESVITETAVSFECGRVVIRFCETRKLHWGGSVGFGGGFCGLQAHLRHPSKWTVRWAPRTDRSQKVMVSCLVGVAYPRPTARLMRAYPSQRPLVCRQPSCLRAAPPITEESQRKAAPGESVVFPLGGFWLLWGWKYLKHADRCSRKVAWQSVRFHQAILFRLESVCRARSSFLLLWLKISWRFTLNF